MKWFLIIIASFLGIVILYLLFWHAFATLAPATYERLELNKVQKNLRLYFNFLFAKGYKIQEAYFYQSFGNWSVQLESENCLIIIDKDRSEISVSFAAQEWEKNTRIGLRPMIYYLSEGKRFIGFYDGDIHRDERGQYKWLAGLLREYLDQIVPYFNNKPETIKKDLVSAQKAYNDLLLSNYIQEHKTN